MLKLVVNLNIINQKCSLFSASCLAAETKYWNLIVVLKFLFHQFSFQKLITPFFSDILYQATCCAFAFIIIFLHNLRSFLYFAEDQYHDKRKWVCVPWVVAPDHDNWIFLSHSYNIIHFNHMLCKWACCTIELRGKERNTSTRRRWWSLSEENVDRWNSDRMEVEYV